jgi:hypothetical protein
LQTSAGNTSRRPNARKFAISGIARNSYSGPSSGWCTSQQLSPRMTVQFEHRVGAAAFVSGTHGLEQVLNKIGFQEAAAVVAHLPRFGDAVAVESFDEVRVPANVIREGPGYRDPKRSLHDIEAE